MPGIGKARGKESYYLWALWASSIISRYTANESSMPSIAKGSGSHGKAEMSGSGWGEPLVSNISEEKNALSWCLPFRQSVIILFSIQVQKWTNRKKAHFSKNGTWDLSMECICLRPPPFPMPSVSFQMAKPQFKWNFSLWLLGNGRGVDIWPPD